MSINFATLQGLTIPEGVVTQITDASGSVIWAVKSGGKVILEVEKITSDTYAGETTYTGEQFILLDIYPKTNGTVSVTYGGLTKTITDTSGAEEPNAQQVFFGTFNGVSDSVATPASGELTIEGDCVGFGTGSYAKSSKYNYACTCVTKILDFGKVTTIPNSAFLSVMSETGFDGLTGELIIPSTITRIGSNAFNFCSGLTTVTICSEDISIGHLAFGMSSDTSNLQVIMFAEVPPTLEYVEDSNTSERKYWNFGDISNDTYAIPTIIVPTGCGEAYKAAEGWSTYADYIMEES